MLIPAAKSLRPLALLLPLFVWGGPADALDYPTRPVRFIVSFAAGGPNDTIARILGQYLSEQLGQQFIIEDHVGAGGNIGMQDVLAAAPDGYTIGFVAPNNAINQTLYANIPFDFLRDSTPIAGTMSLANVMEENLAFPAKNLAEFLALAKTEPGKINFGSGGVGTSPHMSG
jgi:tripartite-type tricarboxylate transporter receptor subunit TctC